MAQMIPVEIEQNEGLSRGEREVFNILKNGLSDEWVVIYSLRWITSDEVHLDKSEGESDFILINPKYGLMIIEVKGGIISCSNRNWTSISQGNIQRDIKDPEKQANEAKFNLMIKFKKNGINPYITTAVWFPDCNKGKCSLPPSLCDEMVLDMNANSTNIEEIVVNIFKHRAEKENFFIDILSDSKYKKVMDILNPTVNVKMPLLRLKEKLNMKFLELNEEQNSVFEQLEGNNFISVKGHAGTGKTILAVKKAFREAEAGKKVLFLCYNDLLEEKIKEEAIENFEVYTIHSLGKEYLKRFNIEAYNNFEEEADYDKMMSDFVMEVKNNKEKNKWLFESIVMDEGQDFTEEWFNGALELLKVNGDFCVFYDENQMVYNKYGRTNIDFLNKGTKYKLKRNMRNTDEICRSSLNVINVEESNIKLNGVKGIEPDILFSENFIDTITHLKAALRELKKAEYLEDDNITVLTMEAKKKIRIKRSIKDEFNGVVESIRRFKGLENDVIIIPDLNNDFMEDEDLRNLLYVGMSRAKAHVILIIDVENFNRKQKIEYKKNIKEKIL